MIRAVVVGAGPAGLISLRSLQKHCEADGVEFVCYERRDHIGGQFVFTDKDETFDANGINMNTTVYKELQMNTATYMHPPHPDLHFPEGTALFPKLEEIAKYFDDFSVKFNLEKYVKFNKTVSEISYDQAAKTFHFKVTDSKTNETEDQTCDYLFLCSGQYLKPLVPDVDLSKFNGEAFHYHYLRDPNRMNNKRVLVVGTSWGAMDMIIMGCKPGRAKTMGVSYRSFPPLWFKGCAHRVSLHTTIETVVGNTVTFKDGSTFEADMIIFCSGFEASYPLCKELQLEFPNRFLFPLWKHLIHPKCHRLFFLGKGNVAGLYLMRPQAEFICMMIKGKVQEDNLPSEEQMWKEIGEFQAHWGKKLMDMATGALDIYKEMPVPLIELECANAVIKMADLAPMYTICGDRFKYIFVDLGLDPIVSDVLNMKNYRMKMVPDPDHPGEEMPVCYPPENRIQ